MLLSGNDLRRYFGWTSTNRVFMLLFGFVSQIFHKIFFLPYKIKLRKQLLNNYLVSSLSTRSMLPIHRPLCFPCLSCTVARTLLWWFPFPLSYSLSLVFCNLCPTRAPPSPPTHRMRPVLAYCGLIQWAFHSKLVVPPKCAVQRYVPSK